MEIDKYKKMLKEFVSFKSISTDPQFRKEIEEASNWIISFLDKNDFQTCTLYGKSTNPYTFGSYVVDPEAETALIYGHYDVQPADKKNGWESDPFLLNERYGRLYGRGVADNKGQVLIHLFTISQLIAAGKLKYNVKFLIEGNEETGNPDMDEIVRRHKDLLACDILLISDGETVQGRPTIEAGYRGGLNMTVKFTTGSNNLHSGLFGHTVPNAAHELAKVIARFYSEDGTVAMPGFYENADAPTDFERTNNLSIGTPMTRLLETTGTKALTLEPDMDFYTQTGLRPMLTVSGFHSGYTGEGYSNIVPCHATAKINFRFVKSQKPEEIAKVFKKFIRDIVPDYVEVEFSLGPGYRPVKLNLEHKNVLRIAELLERAYGDKTVFHYVGGGIPVVNSFIEELGIEPVGVPLANDDCRMHGVDENFSLSMVEKALQFSKMFFSMD